MALIIESGQAGSDSQSYASAADLKAYALARGITVPSDTAQCEALLMKAMDRLLDENFVGDRSSRTQALPWPRIYATVEGWWIRADEIPRNLIYAQCAFAVAAQSVDLLPTQDLNAQGPITEEQVGPVRTVYANKGVVRRVPAVASADALLRTLVRRNGLMAVRV